MAMLYSKALLARTTDGLPQLKVLQPIHKWPVQLTDFVGVNDPRPMIPGKAQLDGTEKWEVINKSLEYSDSNPRVEFQLALVNSSSFVDADLSTNPVLWYYTHPV